MRYDIGFPPKMRINAELQLGAIKLHCKSRPRQKCYVIAAHLHDRAERMARRTSPPYFAFVTPHPAP